MEVSSGALEHRSAKREAAKWRSAHEFAELQGLVGAPSLLLHLGSRTKASFKFSSFSGFSEKRRTLPCDDACSRLRTASCGSHVASGKSHCFRKLQMKPGYAVTASGAWHNSTSLMLGAWCSIFQPPFPPCLSSTEQS